MYNHVILVNFQGWPCFTSGDPDEQFGTEEKNCPGIRVVHSMLN